VGINQTGQNGGVRKIDRTGVPWNLCARGVGTLSMRLPRIHDDLVAARLVRLAVDEHPARMTVTAGAGGACEKLMARVNVTMSEKVSHVTSSVRVGMIHHGVGPLPARPSAARRWILSPLRGPFISHYDPRLRWTIFLRRLRLNNHR
jgi:hypothetical protein